MTSRAQPGRAEGTVQVLILLTIGAVAAAASFTHVHNVAAAHGQPGWLAWADAIVLELMSIATGLEIRRRARTGRPAGFVLAALVTSVALSLAAQVVEAERSIVGWLAAALPALAFLACVKIVLGRTTASPGGPQTTKAAPPPQPVVPAATAYSSVSQPAAAPASTAPPPADTTVPPTGTVTPAPVAVAPRPAALVPVSAATFIRTNSTTVHDGARP